MNAQTYNPTLTPLLRGFIAVVSIVLIIGSGLFFLPDLIGPSWPWKIAPFNAHFLGGIYLSGLAGISVLLVVNKWAPARLALPMGIVFTAVVSVASLMYPGQFDFSKARTYAWFVLYIIPCIIAGTFLWKYRNLPRTDANPTPPLLRYLFQAETILAGLYGLGMFVLPSTFTSFTSFWPWPIDSFHARLYSALFITAAVGAFVLWQRAAQVELLMFGLTHVFIGLFSILGVLTVDISAHRVNWSSAGTWAWMGACALMFIMGAFLIRQALFASQKSTSMSRVYT